MNYTSLMIFFFIQCFIFSLVIAVEEDIDLNSLKYEQNQNIFDNDDFSVVGKTKRKLRKRTNIGIEKIEEEITECKEKIEVLDKEITELDKKLIDKRREKKSQEKKRAKLKEKKKNALKVLKNN
jgi:septal ring factor EnvC (AmiA/AmiB activator)